MLDTGMEKDDIPWGTAIGNSRIGEKKTSTLYEDKFIIPNHPCADIWRIQCGVHNSANVGVDCL